MSAQIRLCRWTSLKRSGRAERAGIGIDPRLGRRRDEHLAERHDIIWFARRETLEVARIVKAGNQGHNARRLSWKLEREGLRDTLAGRQKSVG